MMDQQSKAVSKAYSPVPGVTISMICYLPYVWTIHSEKLAAHLQELDNELAGTPLHNIFIMSLPLVNRIDLSGNVPMWAKALLECYDLFCAHGVIPCWDLFAQVATTESLNALWETYTNTREDLPTAPEILQQEMPVPEDENGDENPIFASGGTL